MKFFTKMGAVLVTALALAGTTTMAHADRLAEIIAEGKIKVGVLSDFPPFGSINDAGQPEGFDIDVANLMAKQLGVELELVPITAQSRVPSLLANHIDILIAGLGITGQRAMQVAYSQRYAGAELGVYGHEADAAIQSIDDLTGKTIAVGKGTTTDIWLTNNAPNATVVQFEDIPSAVSAFVAGQTDYVGEMHAMLGELKKRNSSIQAERLLALSSETLHLAVNQNNPDFLRWVDIFIFLSEKNGSLQDLREKWMDSRQEGLPRF